MRGGFRGTVIGLDLGRKYPWCRAISTETGEVLGNERVSTRREEFLSFLRGLPRPIRVVMEATGTWQYPTNVWRGGWRRSSWPTL
jgi:hypothetical protein